jgi:hypothetical protein
VVVRGIRGFHGSQILIPSRPDLQPGGGFLPERYEIFRKAV